MQTNDNSSRKTFAIGLIGGLGLAAAIGAAFVLGGQAGGTEPQNRGEARSAVGSPTASGDAPASNSIPVVRTDAQDSQAAAPVDTGDAPGPEEDVPAVEPTATPEAEEPADTDEDDPTVTPTVTPEPGDGCLFCIDPEIIIPLPTEDPGDPCPFCLDVDLVFPIDVTPPTISNVDTSFCFPILVVSLEVDATAEVWFEYEYNGNDYESIHKDAANDTFIPEDMGGFGWGVYFISSIDVHAVDLSGNHAMTTIGMPDPDLGC